MKYYPIQKKWAKIKPLIQNKEVQDILVDNFNKFTFGRWGQRFKHGMKPHEFESCDWWCHDRRGRMPEYWNYVKHAASHWLVNFNLKLAMLAEPQKDWQIVRGHLHSTVWDGEETLFDMQFLALGISPDEAFELAYEDCDLIEIGKTVEIYFAESVEDEQLRKQIEQNGFNGN